MLDNVEVISIVKNSISHINSSIPSLPKVLSRLRGAQLPNGDLIACGGLSGSAKIEVSSIAHKLDEYLHYKAGSNQWANIGTMARKKAWYSSVWVDDCLYTTGGSDSSLIDIACLEEFSITGGAKERKEMPMPLSSHTATTFGPHKMIVCGGMNRNVSETFPK